MRNMGHILPTINIDNEVPSPLSMLVEAKLIL